MKRFLILFIFLSSLAFSQSDNIPFSNTGGEINIPGLELSLTNPEDGKGLAFSLRLMLILALLSLAPSLILLTTSFLRIFIVLDFIRKALSLQQMPPNQVISGISLFLTAFIMWPIFTEIYEDGYKPLAENEITIEESYKRMEKPLRIFMFKQLNNNYNTLSMFSDLAKQDKPKTLEDVPTYVLIPAFVLNELRIAFVIGVLIFVPFIIIDMVIASVLMAMGMIMLPPVMISLPFKVIVFVLVDGWDLIIRQMIEGFLN